MVTPAPRHASPQLHTGIVEWGPGDELIAAVADEVARLGHHVTLLPPGGPVPPAVDVLLVFGPFGSIAPLMTHLAAQPTGRRPVFVWWLTEQLPHPSLPHWIAGAAGDLRSAAERLIVGRGAHGVAPIWRALGRRGLRLRYYGDLRWLRRNGLLSVLVVPSHWLSRLLRRRGFEVTQGFVGAHPSFAAAPELDRDISVLWLGTPGSRRRVRNLQRVTDALARRGVAITAIDGIRQPPVFGAERARLLSRTKIVLNLLRQPWDSNMLRFFFAAPNRALMISEPLLDHYPPVQAGVHLVETSLARMADEVCRYLDDEIARNRITEQAHRLVTTELTLARGVAAVMRQAVEVRAAAAT